MSRFSRLRGGWRAGLAALTALAAVALGSALGSARAATSAPPAPTTQASTKASAAVAPGSGTDPIGAHSMLYLSSPYSFKRAMFAEAAAMHASAIRVEVAPTTMYAAGLGKPDYSGLDQYMALAQEYHLRVVGVLLSIPPSLADCAWPTAQINDDRCGTDDLAEYGDIVREIVSHADPVIRDWEIWNEPDTRSFFDGSPQQYAHMLRTAYDAVKQVDPSDQVLLGGISHLRGMSWLAQVLATPGADAIHAFDIANVHQRGRLDSLAPAIQAWRRFLARRGFQGPLWVTEHGYPSNPRYQHDPGYEQGEVSQAAYLRASIPTLVEAGASKVFITERDNLTGSFASEGVLGGDVHDPQVPDPTVVAKPAFTTVQSLAGCYLLLGRDCPTGGSPSAAAPPSPTG